MKTRKIRFVCNAVRWFDSVNGNTYHSVRVTRCCNGKVIGMEHPPFTYGYDDSYRQTALEAMEKAKWIPPTYRGKHDNGFPKYMEWERNANYPVDWNVTDGLKREMIANGTI